MVDDEFLSQFGETFNETDSLSSCEENTSANVDQVMFQAKVKEKDFKKSDRKEELSKLKPRGYFGTLEQPERATNIININALPNYDNSKNNNPITTLVQPLTLHSVPLMYTTNVSDTQVIDYLQFLTNIYIILFIPFLYF